MFVDHNDMTKIVYRLRRVGRFVRFLEKLGERILGGYERQN
jgi:hypothetical protein